MFKFIVLFPILISINCACAGLEGPFLFWGQSQLVDVKLPALRTIDEQVLSCLYEQAKAIMVFLRNSSVHLDKQDYPKLSELLSSNNWSYFPQQSLPIEPFDRNPNLEVVTVSGDCSQQDTEISALYKDAVSLYGAGKVLAILASQEGDSHYLYRRHLYKREAEEPKTTAPSKTSGETKKDFIYIVDGKALFYTSSAPILHLNISGNIERFELEEHEETMTFEDKGDFGRLNIPFVVDGSVLHLSFNFTRARGYWSISAINIKYKESDLIFPISRRSFLPEAPIGFSYRCSSSDMHFHGTDGNLTIKDFQVQPWLKGKNKFSEAYNCVGFMTVPIWSGIFICSILIGILSLGINMLMSINTPTRFETSRSKQLTFTVQD